MPAIAPKPLITADGKFFRSGDKRHWLRAVTYGPFPAGKEPDPTTEFARIRSAGFTSVRVFTLPDRKILTAAEDAGLIVFGGLDWRLHEDFLSRPALLSSARVRLAAFLREHGSHPALGGVYVGNEIPTDLVRWMGPVVVRRVLEELIELGRSISPQLLFAYANYPSTEFLEPANADFSAFNVYLEERQPFTDYLRRLQNISGDRPLVISEFGMDSKRNSPEEQAETLAWAMEIAHYEETAGFTVFSWSDLWETGGNEVPDWDFGLTDRNGAEKPALAALSQFEALPPSPPKRKFSVIVCTHNGAERIDGCLRAIASMDFPPHETIVVSDGSTDATESIVSGKYPQVRLISIPPSGLSAARNAGAAAATGEVFAFTDDDCEPDREWLSRLDRAFDHLQTAAAGGPNLPPAARSLEEAVIRAAPGAPSHVLLDDTEAEHLPGCNIAVRRGAFEQIGGFDIDFRTAGDDVDFCWRLSDAGFHLGFVPGAFVWHWRRPSIRTFLKQQKGYGVAEHILLGKHPERFAKNGEARWKGFIYGGGAVRAGDDSVIYHGVMGQAGYQSVVNRMLPLRPIDSAFGNACSQSLLRLVRFLQPLLRRWARCRRVKWPSLHSPQHAEVSTEDFRFPDTTGLSRDAILAILLDRGWAAAGSTVDWDVEKDGTRALLATEYLDQHHANHLFRIWGDPAQLFADLPNFR
ncbi:MAG: glycosyltransferase [Luteolibacter sp.]